MKPKFYVLLKHDETALGKMFDETPLSPYLTPRETAEIFNVTRATIMAWRRKGKFKKYICFSSHTFRYNKEEVARILGFDELANRMKKEQDNWPSK